MKRRIIYIAEDGKEFDNRSDCLSYMKTRANNKELFKARDLLKKYYNDHVCDHCIFEINGFSPCCGNCSRRLVK